MAAKKKKKAVKKLSPTTLAIYRSRKKNGKVVLNFEIPKEMLKRMDAVLKRSPTLGSRSGIGRRALEVWLSSK